MKMADPARMRRGECPSCGMGVYNDQPRLNDNGTYYHEACLEADKNKSKSLKGQSTNIIQNPSKQVAGAGKLYGPSLIMDTRRKASAAAEQSQVQKQSPLQQAERMKEELYRKLALLQKLQGQQVTVDASA